MNLTNISAIIDVSHYFYRFMHVMLAKDDKALLKSNKQVSLVKDIHASIVNDIRSCGFNISRVIMAQDGDYGSWRKQISKYQEVAYKGNRSDRDSIPGIENINKLMSGYCDILNKKNIPSINVKHMEGDDIIKIVTDQLLQENISSIIFSGDGDMVQILRKTESAAVFLYNTNKKTIFSCFPIESKIIINEVEKSSTTPNINDVFEEDGIFDLSTESVITEKNTDLSDIEIVNPTRSLFAKMCAKEVSDNIPSVYYYQKGTQTVSFTELRAKEIFDISYKDANYDLFKNLYTNNEDRMLLANFIYILASGKPKNAADKERIENARTTETITIANNIKRNLTFVWLDEIVYRDNLREIVNMSYEEVLEAVRNKISNLDYGVFDNSLLSDTIYELRQSNTIQSNESCLF